MTAHQKPSDGNRPLDSAPDPLQVLQQVEILFAAGEISFPIFREMLRQCHEALKAAPETRAQAETPPPVKTLTHDRTHP